MGNGNNENRIKETHQCAGEQTNNNINNINTSITCSIGKSDCELREGNSASNDDLAKDDYTLFVLQLQEIIYKPNKSYWSPESEFWFD